MIAAGSAPPPTAARKPLTRFTACGRYEILAATTEAVEGGRKHILACVECGARLRCTVTPQGQAKPTNARHCQHPLVDDATPYEDDVWCQALVSARLRVGLTLDEIGASMKCTRERARQLEAGALASLRRVCEREGLDAAQVADYLASARGEPYEPDHTLDVQPAGSLVRSIDTATIAGQTRPILEWLEHYGTPHARYYSRIGRGWPRVRAITEPPYSRWHPKAFSRHGS